MEKLNIPCSFSNLTSKEDSRFLRCSVKVQHDKENLNNSCFDKEDMLRCAEKSLRLTPILGSVVYDEELEDYRLNGHDVDYKLVEKDGELDLKVSHVERIYGFVPHDAPISTEYDELNDKTYLLTEAVLWKNYLDEVEDILNNKDGNTEVSMEISVNDSKFNEQEVLQIVDYTFEGISMLGVKPAMEGANLQLFSNDNDRLKQEIKELMKAYSLEKEVDNVENEEIVVEELDETVEITEESQEVTEEAKDQIEDEVIETEVEVEEVQEPTEFELLQGKHETVVADFEELKEKYAELECKLNSMGDYEELKEFKDAYDTAKYEQEVNEITSMFDCLDEDDVKELRSQVLAKEITKESYQEKLAYKQFMKEKSVKKNYSVDKTESSEISIFGESVEIKNRPYGGEFDKYLNK